jgi:hypothetical protein
VNVRLRLSPSYLVLVLAFLLVSQARAAGGADNPCSFALHLRALTSPAETELAVGVTSASTDCTAPGELKKVQVKTFSLDGKLAGVENVEEVASPGGQASMQLPALARGQRLEVQALVQTEQSVRTYVLSGATAVLLRPDLAVVRVGAPRQVLTGKRLTVDADVKETNGDVGATATAVLTSGGATLGSQQVDVAAGGTAPVSFVIAFEKSGSYPLEVRVVDASPPEANLANNAAGTTVEVTEFELSPQNVLVRSLAGYGAQFNQHVYAKLSSPPVNDQNVLEMESKVIALQPNLARIFFNTTELTQADRMASFIRTVQLAQRAGSTINVTWQDAGQKPNLSRFADVLIDLVKHRGVTNLRWVTLQNEPNTTAVTPQQNEANYRTLDALLSAAGARQQIRFMGGDLVAQNQRVWFDYMATHMSDILDAWSIHIFWDYWDTPKLVQRLQDVRGIWDGEPEAGRKPIYVMEYGVRGNRTLNGVPQGDPGSYEDGTPITRTNINAFQHAWFTVLSSRLGYLGDVKWDSYFGKYDNGTQSYYMIGSPVDGWPLYPVYHATRLLTLTTRPGWQVVGLDGGSGGKLLTAYSGPAGEVTVVGLDTDGAMLNRASETQVPYSVGGLPPSTSFHLLFWNHDGGGGLSSAGVVASDGAGVAQVETPLSGMFALTTLDVQA